MRIYIYIYTYIYIYIYIYIHTYIHIRSHKDNPSSHYPHHHNDEVDGRIRLPS